MKCSLDKSVVFDSESHTYTKNGKKLTSVTSFISQFKNKFDSDYHSKRIAEKEGKTQTEILKLWSDKAKKSCDIGTAIHKIFEEYIDGNFCVLGNEILIDFVDLDIEYLVDFYPKSKVAIQFIKDFFISGRLTPVYTEYIVHNDTLAGQVDLICKDKQKNYYILDFKTNDKIEVYSYNKKMLGIFKEINDSSFYHYSLQLSIYKQMFDKEVKGLFLVHIKPDKYEFIECVDIFHNYNIDFNKILNGS
jgi:ATP-dependent exoDNAse (exonuclease V) beta subunit